ncbi:hypothetical protein RF11_12836 [Thelohanellus kitauei]|uniref:Uncharacterized protein n=1 Tax=Thelohanellus kitauei TaxID=669202 RepID=A0A0C2MID0_THEKT|nr:hypothetical protein RF11_12836 [Thelohanellus kitauei]
MEQPKTEASEEKKPKVFSGNKIIEAYTKALTDTCKCKEAESEVRECYKNLPPQDFPTLKTELKYSMLRKIYDFFVRQRVRLPSGLVGIDYTSLNDLFKKLHESWTCLLEALDTTDYHGDAGFKNLPHIVIDERLVKPHMLYLMQDALKIAKEHSKR